MTPPAPQSPSIGNEVPSSLRELLASVANGTVGVDQAAGSVASMMRQTDDGKMGALGEVASIPGATVDLGRRDRCGFGEVIYGEGKSTDLMIRIVETQLGAEQSCLITRIDPTSAAQLRRHFRHTHHNPAARTLRIAGQPAQLVSPVLDDAIAHVAVVTAGSTDASVAEEAVETLTWMGIAHRRVEDIGVAGPQRLLAAVPALRKAAAIVVIAGMEGALPPTVAGHVGVPVIAVPTSTGYGANFAGLTPLMGMLTSCAANVAVVNIDAGFKGAYLAGLIATQLIAAEKDAKERSISQYEGV
ncbi:nickel pincer cofactor biosynthesis protein LarB [Aporhodopirellula aestuarii]|uniref:Nickel pincer cofactor biosynthesis protein LarB n=1 Tax=Aporhodopirellula aestuarii TaxID=2950107 RepID=A0ABT0UBY6_9BACT|nr:nickel pincer cofactor biosynthesis protein LarB [Aporhodopirellula aestuarii]MCM2374532.1 nickel pincer cofactor biosynthesis protein LarB [Aporhodopirellula aestuarii]